MNIDNLYGITKTLTKKLHEEGIYTIDHLIDAILADDLCKTKLKLPKHILISAKLRRFETRVDRQRANVEYKDLERYVRIIRRMSDKRCPSNSNECKERKTGELILAGSYRRGKEDMKDLDFILITDNISTKDLLRYLPKDIYFPILEGEKKLMLYSFHETPSDPLGQRLSDNDPCKKAIRIDLNIVPTISRATALVHYSGSAENNIKMRITAKKNGYLLNEKHILNLETGVTIYPKTEKEVFDIIGYEYRDPEFR